MSKDFTIEKGNWTVTFNDIFTTQIEGKKLTPEAWGIYVFMLSLPDTWDYTVAGLMTVVNAGRDKINRVLNELETAGFLIREQTTEGGRFGKMKYTLLQIPKTPFTEKPSTVKPITENKQQQSTKELNTNKQSTKESNTKVNIVYLTPEENEMPTLSLIENIALENNISKPVYQKFYHYYKARNFLTGDKIKITPDNVSNFLILWDNREIKDFNNNPGGKVNEVKPDWIDKYIIELENMEG